MCRPNIRPFYTFGKSKTGKTVIGTNCVLECVKLGYSQIGYVSTTYYTPQNTFLRNNVLRQFIYNPTARGNDQIEQYENFINWLMRFLNIAMDQLKQEENSKKIINKYLSQDEQAQIKYKQQSYCSRLKIQYPYAEILSVIYTESFQIAQMAATIFQSIYNQSDIIDFYNKFEEQLQQLQRLFAHTQNNVVCYQKQYITKTEAFNQFKGNLQKSYNQYIQLIEQQQRKFIKVQYDQLVHENKQLVDECLQNPLSWKGEQKIKDICFLVQTKFRCCIIFDDISDIIKGISKCGTKHSQINLPIKDLFNQCMGVIASKGRHIGTFYVAVHSPSDLDAQLRQQIGNYIISPYTISSFNNQRTEQQDKTEINQICALLAQYNGQDLHHYVLVYFDNSLESPDGNKYCFLQAPFNKRDKFNTQAYKNTCFYDLAKKQ